MPGKVWGEINHLSIPKLQRLHHWSLGMDKWFHPILYWTCDYLSMLGLKLNHVSKRGYKWPTFAVFSGQCPSHFVIFLRLPAAPLVPTAFRFGGILQNWGQKVARFYSTHGSHWKSHSFLNTWEVLQSMMPAMMTSSNGNIFRVTGPFVRGIHRSPVNSHHKGQWWGALMFSFICAWQLGKQS